MKPLLHRAASVFSLMSRVPVRLETPPDYSSVGWMLPLVGIPASIAAMAGAAVGLALFGPGVLSAISAVTVQYLAFNLFHFDGLADTADALGVTGDAERRREALKDPRLGSFGVFAAVLTLSARIAALATVLGSGALAWACLALAPAAGRLSALIAAWLAPPPDGSGLGSILSGAKPAAGVAGFVSAAAPAALLAGLAYGALGAALAIPLGAAAALLGALPPALWYRKTFGSVSGDALGAAVELGELSILLLAAALAV